MSSVKKLLSNLEEYLIAGIMAYLAFTVVLQVVMRHVVGQSLSWSEESLRFSFIWMILLGFSSGVKHDSHIRVLLVFDRLKGTARYLVQMIVHLLFLFTAAYVFYLSLLNYLSFAQFPQVSPALGVPMQYVYLAGPVGFGMTAIRLVEKLVVDTRMYFAGASDGSGNEEAV